MPQFNLIFLLYFVCKKKEVSQIRSTYFRKTLMGLYKLTGNH